MGCVVLRLGNRDAVDVRLGPIANSGNRLDERPSEWSEFVFDARRHFGVNRAADEAVALQTAQRLRQHLLRNAVDAPLQMREALGFVLQQANNQYRPFIGDAIQHATRWTFRGVNVG